MSPFGNKLIEKLPPLPKELKTWVRGAFAPSVRLAALSLPRGNGKTFLCANISRLLLEDAFRLNQSGNEIIVVSGSLEQSRTLFDFIVESIEPKDRKRFKICNSVQRLWIQNKENGFRVRAISSRGRKSLGLASFGLLIGDEPSAWETKEGEMMFHSLRTSLGKRKDARLLLAGTLAPSYANWYSELIKSGTNKETGTFVTCIKADDHLPWNEWETVKAVNPMMKLNKTLREVVKKELAEAIHNPSLQPSFEAYRLNRELNPAQEMLCKVSEWEAVERRSVPARNGRPIVGLDLGLNRSWSAVWCLWNNGRSECYALAPGLPGLPEQEKKDSVPSGLYQDLFRKGVLFVDEGLRVARPQALVDHLVMLGIEPEIIICDRFLVDGLRDAVPPSWKIETRKTRWSEGSEDISAFRRLVADGPLSIVPECRALAKFSLSQAVVVSDEQNQRISKKDRNKARNDVAVCATLACGEFVRRSMKPERRSFRYVVV